jgi:hypothetical protein
VITDDKPVGGDTALDADFGEHAVLSDGRNRPANFR